jgi:mono/diheme cytochrome c family protein
MFPKTAVIISQTTGRSPHAQAMWAWKLLYTVPSLLQLTLVIGLAGTVSTALAVEPSRDELQRQFAASVRPFLQTYCQSCHSPEKSEAELDLSGFSTLADVARRHPIWEIVLERLEAREMPPAEAKPQPTMDQRRAVVEWIRAFRRHEAQRHAGDPGPVLARRLSNAEYNYTIRDLTGVDIRPAQEFPIDPANAAGFDNSGESLAMSPALLQKYLDAARRVTEHLVLTPEGFAFAPHPAVTETDRDKYCVKRIVAFYQHQPTDYADYFLAAWRYRHRESLGQPTATLADIATADHVSAKYLARVWSALTESAEAVGRAAVAGWSVHRSRSPRLRAVARLRRPAAQATRV